MRLKRIKPFVKRGFAFETSMTVTDTEEYLFFNWTCSQLNMASLYLMLTVNVYRVLGVSPLRGPLKPFAPEMGNLDWPSGEAQDRLYLRDIRSRRHDFGW